MKPKILVIEDHPDVLNAIVFLLKSAECHVTAAQTGAEGIQLAQNGDFDLITLDIDLPDINGFEVCSRLKVNFATQSIPVVFVSGRICEQDKIRGLALGAADYIAKPFDSLKFVQRILTQIKLPEPVR